MPDTDTSTSYARLLDDFGLRLAGRWSFTKTYVNASLAAVWAVISIAVAGPDAILLVGVPKFLITVHLMLALHMFEIVIIGYYMGAELQSGGSTGPQGGDGRGAGGKDATKD